MLFDLGTNDDPIYKDYQKHKCQNEYYHIILLWFSVLNCVPPLDPTVRCNPIEKYLTIACPLGLQILKKHWYQQLNWMHVLSMF